MGVQAPSPMAAIAAVDVMVPLLPSGCGLQSSHEDRGSRAWNQRAGMPSGPVWVATIPPV
jgi:hypothetical protein